MQKMMKQAQQMAVEIKKSWQRSRSKALREAAL
jgi:hypothetical protein